MCCCASPNVNGTPGYQWGITDRPITRPVSPPTLGQDDIAVFDLPGRCGGMDSHCHHYTVTTYGRLYYRHGGGQGHMRLSGWPMLHSILFGLDDNARYWLLNTIYHAAGDAQREAHEKTATRWATAVVEKRIKVSRRGGRATVRVIEPPAPTPEAPREIACKP